MCFKSGSSGSSNASGGGSAAAAADVPAPAPAPPAPAPEEPEIGTGRKKESREEFGADVPNYRVSRKASTTPSSSPGQIQM